MIHKVREAIELLRRDGWVLVQRTGTGHRQFTHPTKPGRVTVSGKESADLAPKTWASILRQAGLK
jgi:predicted RNA binding protein YcfA (HicA-like mRNA interferase family)